MVLRESFGPAAGYRSRWRARAHQILFVARQAPPLPAWQVRRRSGGDRFVLGDLALYHLPAVEIAENLLESLQFTRKLRGATLVGIDRGFAISVSSWTARIRSFSMLGKNFMHKKERFAPVMRGTNLPLENSYFDFLAPAYRFWNRSTRPAYQRTSVAVRTDDNVSRCRRAYPYAWTVS